MPWTASGPTLGFSPGGAAWLPQPEWFGKFAAAGQQDSPDSTLNLYRAALARRRDLFLDTALDWLPVEHPDVIAFRRGTAVNITNMGNQPIELPESCGAISLRSAPFHGRQVPPDTSVC